MKVITQRAPGRRTPFDAEGTKPIGKGSTKPRKSMERKKVARAEERKTVRRASPRRSR